MTPKALIADTPFHATRLQLSFWNRIARRYASDPIADLAGYEKTLARVAERLDPRHEVLEWGCGTGTTALRLAAGTRHYQATDLAPEMIAIAREKLAEQPGLPLHFGVADAAGSQLAVERFDAVLAFNLLHLLPDLGQSLARLLAPLKPGGLFISKTPCVGEMNPLLTRLAIPIARLLGKAPPVLIFREPTLLQALQAQGLHIEAVERHGSKGPDIRVFIVARKP
ncbi:MAG: class I SAM-dependent methyltransferase [Inhella sp.]